MTFAVHLLDLSENSPQCVFDDADFKYEKFPGIPPAVFSENKGVRLVSKALPQSKLFVCQNVQY